MLYDEVIVGQFCSLYIEGTEKVRIWDCDDQATVFEGTFKEAKDSEFATREVCSFGIEDSMICINI